MVLDMILGSFGLTTIDENLQGLIQQMQKLPNNALTNDAISFAKAIGFLIALGVGSYECYMMILGRRGMDVMKLLYIIIISICITCSSWICEAARQPGLFLQETAQELAEQEKTNVQYLEFYVNEKQQTYLNVLKKIQADLDKQKVAEERSFWQAFMDGDLSGYINEQVDEFEQKMDQRLQNAAISVETTVVGWINAIIKFLCELLFQVSFYGMMVAQYLFLNILEIFCPIAFAMSLAPPFRSAWSQWLSKFLSLSLWGFIIFMILYSTYFIMEYSLDIDYKTYEQMGIDALNNSEIQDWSTVGHLGLQQIGTTCMYVVGLLVGVFLLKFVPEVSSWLIPGGVSSGAGGAASSVVTGGASMAVGGATAVAGAAVGAAPVVASGGSKVLNTIGSDLKNAQEYMNGGGKLY